MSSESTKIETTDSVSQASETVRECRNRLARDRYTKRMSQETMYAGHTENTRDRKNRLAREARALRTSTLTNQQLTQQRAQERKTYARRMADETIEQTEQRRKIRRKTYAQRVTSKTMEGIKKQRTKRRKSNHHTARIDQYDSNSIQLHDLGSMDINCVNCGALHWKNERVAGTVQAPIFSTCCAKDKVHLPSLTPTPPGLLALLTEDHARARDFRNKIHMYNSALAFTSMGAKIDERVAGTSGVYTFRIHGEMYHQIGTLLPENQANPLFCQIYMYDTDEQQRYRQCIMPNLDNFMLFELQEILHKVNPYVHTFRQAAQLLRENPTQDLKMMIVKSRNKHQYTTPTASEVAVLIVGNNQESECLNCDIILHKRKGGLQRISQIHPSYIPLHYVLLFPHGEPGWHPNILTCNTSCDQTSDDTDNLENHDNNEEEDLRRVTMMQYYAYRLQVHRYVPQESFALHRAGRLFQQYIVDAYACIEQNRLYYLRSNQKQIRIDLYSGLQDMLIANDELPQNGTHIGKRILLPSSFIEISNRNKTDINSNIPEVTDEIQQYIDARYVSASESFWRIMHCKMHGEAPNIIRLAVHLPRQHLVTFADNESLDVIIQRASDQKTTLTAWFQANSDPSLSAQAKKCTYAQFPYKFVFNKCSKK
ncbi:1602_t:CDS:2 [Acaulospora morrowiae]|uniref:1602_t:CDS:1 n=1 Tax=Acaulospora morrowiae TaxID=94023 RepID=A0A9N8WPB5_9GLOM|nr:1602_t:CDS:2 [Acaulospora morrowiae]